MHWQLASLIAAFAIVSIASERIGLWLRSWRLPLITGFLATGIIAGPYVLDLINAETVRALAFVDQVSLAVIAFAAGNELYLKELRSRLRAIAWISVAQLAITFLAVTTAVFLLADLVPFMASMPTAARVAVSMLAGAILVARSPSSAIAIVNELRAKGPFTKTMLGVTVALDIAVIVLFASCFSVAASLLSDEPFSAVSLLILIAEIAASVGIGVGIGWLLHNFLARAANRLLRTAVVLSLGYAVFAGSIELREWSHRALGHHIHLEPLLICMVASFWVTNFTDGRRGLTRLIHRLCPPIYVAFFTLTGASLELDVLPDTFHIALVLFAVRIGGVWAGNHVGGRICGEPPLHNKVGWMAYLTQAGVALGLAKNVAAVFPTWGGSFATTIVALIVINQVVGPPLLKWAIGRVGEDRSRAETAEFDGTRDALIFGLEGQSIALASVLSKAGWRVTIGCPVSRTHRKLGDMDVEVHPIAAVNAETLADLRAERADAIVGLMNDEQNLRLCELAYQNYGTRVLVVRLEDLAYLQKFEELGVLVIDPRSIVVGLLDRAVRSPTSAALVLGHHDDNDIIDVDVANVDIAGLAVRDLRLPMDVAVLYIHRDGTMLSAKGTTILREGDRVTITGPTEHLEVAARKLEG